jgi:hypothetical protein
MLKKAIHIQAKKEHFVSLPVKDSSSIRCGEKIETSKP